MWDCFVHYPLADKKIIDKALPYVKDIVFCSWHFPPTITVGKVYQEDEDDEPEYEIYFEYENKNSDDDTEAGHYAFDLFYAFINGVLFQEKIKNNDGWFEYLSKYEKQACAIELKDGRIFNHCYPNAGQFHILDQTGIEPIDEDQVVKIKYIGTFENS